MSAWAIVAFFKPNKTQVDEGLSSISVWCVCVVRVLDVYAAPNAESCTYIYMFCMHRTYEWCVLGHSLIHMFCSALGYVIKIALDVFGSRMDCVCVFFVCPIIKCMHFDALVCAYLPVWHRKRNKCNLTKTQTHTHNILQTHNKSQRVGSMAI